jgi:sugar transferase (PEP-CTERM/EpsH1 system associated)
VNILYLCHRIPYPPDKGDKIRSFPQVRHLGERHRVALVCFVDDPADLAHVAALRQWCVSVDAIVRSGRMARLAGLRGLLDGRAISVAAFDSGRLRRAVESRIGDADVVTAYSSVMAQYVSREAGLPRLMDFVDADSEKWRLYASRSAWPTSWIYTRETDRLGHFEEAVARDWEHSVFVSEREAQVVRARAPGRPITVLGNGVDLSFFTPHEGPEDPGRGRRIVFTGAMDYFPNVDGVRHFCDEILPRIRIAIPEARFAIVGRNPAPGVRRLASRAGVEVTGTVPDVRPFLRGAAVAVAPLRVARGAQNKTLEAMASGLPVVCSAAVADGLGVGEPAGVDVADDPGNFASRVVALLEDPERRRVAGARARAYVERNHRWEDHCAGLEALLIGLARAKTGASA